MHLFDNRLTGEIPRELGRLGNLRQLNLADNQLTGPIPDELGFLADRYSLRELGLRGNNLEGCVPGSLQQMVDAGEPGLEDCWLPVRGTLSHSVEHSVEHSVVWIWRGLSGSDNRAAGVNTNPAMAALLLDLGERTSRPGPGEYAAARRGVAQSRTGNG